MRLAIKQFGQPFRVGRDIAQKWETKRKRQTETAKPIPTRQRKWLKFLTTIITSWGGIWCVMNYHAWPVILTWAVGQGILYGLATGHIAELDEEIDGPKGAEWPEMQKELRESRIGIREQVSQSKNLWGKLTMLFVQRLTERYSTTASNPFARAISFGWTVSSVSWSLAYLAVLIFCSAISHGRIIFWTYLIFYYVTDKAGTISKVIITRRLLRGRSA